MFRVEDLRVRHIGPVGLDLSGGCCTGLGGPSGSGKTLLLRAIADLEVHTGQCLLDDRYAEEMAPAQWRRQVGFLPAESAWWHDTVRPHFARIDESAFAALGFGTEVADWSVSRLSTGERQRLALLRLLSGRPRVLLLDEPTANLDGDNSRAMEVLLADYRKQQSAALLWVTHDPSQLERVADNSARLTPNGQLEWS